MATTLKPSKQPSTPGAGVPTIWLDGKWYDRDTAMVSVYDHGLLYGDGVFEGIRTYGGKIFRLRDHLERLYDSAKALWLTVPMPTRGDGLGHAAGGRAGGYRRGLHPPHRYARRRRSGTRSSEMPAASVIIIVDRIKLWPEEVYETGLTVVTAGTPIPQRESLSPRVKSLNYLAHILAKIEGIQAGADEVLMLDSSGASPRGRARTSSS